MKEISLGILLLSVIAQSEIFELTQGKKVKLIVDGNRTYILTKKNPLNINMFEKVVLPHNTQKSIEVSVGNIILNTNSKEYINPNPPKKKMTFKDYVAFLTNTIKNTGVLKFLVVDLRTPSKAQGKSADAIPLTLSKKETSSLEIQIDNPTEVRLTLRDMQKKKLTTLTNGSVNFKNLENGVYKLFIKDKKDGKILKKFKITLTD